MPNKTAHVIGVAVLAILTCGAAHAGAALPADLRQAGVYSGCEVPKQLPSAHAFYIDPIHGSMNGDGSKARPWHTLEEVVNAGLISTAPITKWNPLRKIMAVGKPNAQIAPGDTVYLLTGDHGEIKLQGSFGSLVKGYDNPDFITITALPGQTPVLQQLTINGGSKWVFRGLTFRATNPELNGVNSQHAHHLYWLLSMAGPHSNIIIDGNHFESQPDVQNWNMQDWLHKAASGVVNVDGSCLAVTNNVFKNVGFGISSQDGARMLFAGNTIDHFSDDGIDYGSDDMLIENNRITNGVESGDGIHRDGMQGQPHHLRTTPIENITIRNNTVIRLTDPTLKYPAVLQGIDAFDGAWKNVTVANNVVVTDAWHGISFYGADHLTISGNIVLHDSGKVVNCVKVEETDCAKLLPVIDTTMIPGILVHASKKKVLSSEIKVSGNIAHRVAVEADQGEMSDNVCLPQNGKCPVEITTGGIKRSLKKGDLSGGNIVYSRDASEMFKKYDPETMSYDLTLVADPRSHPKRSD